MAPAGGRGKSRNSHAVTLTVTARIITIYRTAVKRKIRFPEQLPEIFFDPHGAPKMPATDYVTQTGAGPLAGVTEATIRAAIKRGELIPEQTRDGTTLLRVVDVLQWATQTRPRGRKPRAAGPV
jgi:hypothetical protein